MKTPIIRYTLWVLVLLVLQLSVNAQTPATNAQAPVTKKTATKKPKVKVKKQFAIDFDAGVALPRNKELSDIFTAGANATFGFKVALLKSKKLWIRPMGGLQFYSKKIEFGDAVHEAFREWKAGVEVQYRAANFKKYSIYPIIRVENNWCSNQFSKQTIIDESNTRILQVSDNFMKGTGISYNAGVMVMRSNELYIKIDYQYFKPDLKVNPDVVKQLLTEGFTIPDHKVYDCSTLNVSVGFTLNFKK